MDGEHELVTQDKVVVMTATVMTKMSYLAECAVQSGRSAARESSTQSLLLCGFPVEPHLQRNT